MKFASELDRRLLSMLNVLAGRQDSADHWCVVKMTSMNKGNEEKTQGANRKQLLEELNEKRESYCLVERSNEVNLLRVQKRHFSKAYQTLACMHIKESVPESTRTSWVKHDLSVHKEKRHFLPKSKTIGSDSDQPVGRISRERGSADFLGRKWFQGLALGSL